MIRRPLLVGLAALSLTALLAQFGCGTGEPPATYELYGAEAKVRGTFASSALMARRLVVRGVRFGQIFHRGLDQHGAPPSDLASQCKDVDQASFGLIQDLKQRGLLKDTILPE